MYLLCFFSHVFPITQAVQSLRRKYFAGRLRFSSCHDGHNHRPARALLTVQVAAHFKRPHAIKVIMEIVEEEAVRTRQFSGFPGRTDNDCTGPRILRKSIEGPGRNNVFQAG